MKIRMMNVFGEEIYNDIIREKLAEENTKIANKVLKVMRNGYFPRVAVNHERETFRWDWMPDDDEYVPKYASRYIKKKMMLWFGIEYEQVVEVI